MKTIRTIRNCIILALAVLYAVSCAPVPAGWEGTPNLLDTPGIYGYSPASEGVSGHEWM